MPYNELSPKHEFTSDRRVRIYTPDTLRTLERSDLPGFYEAVDLLRASIDELRDMNGVETTDESLNSHEIVYTQVDPTVPALRSWNAMMTKFPDRIPFLITIEDKGNVIAVCEGRVYPFLYNRAQVSEGIEQPLQEKAIFIEQTGITTDYRGNREDNIADQLYRELYALAKTEDVTLIIGAVNQKNELSRRVVLRQGRTHITVPPLNEEGISRDPD
jgi:hypothetical protein